MAQISENHSITSVEAAKAIRKAFKKQRPVFLWGSMGIGKSEVVQGIADSLGYPLIDIRLAQCEPTDIRGIPFFNKEIGKMDWAPPVDLPDEEFASQYPGVVLFLDEMNSAPTSVQAAAYQLTLNRRVGKYKLPDNVVVIAAGNRASDKGVTYAMPRPLANRFLHLEMRADFDSWQAWAVTNKIHKDVVSFLSFAPQHLADFDPKSTSQAFATPRTWTFVSELLEEDDVDSGTLFNLIAGAVGQGLATKFMAHRRLNGQLPNPRDILSGKVKTFDVREEQQKISAMYSLTVGMCYELSEYQASKDYKEKEMTEMAERFFFYMMDNFQPEIAVMGGRIALKTYDLNMDLGNMKSIDVFTDKYGDYLNAA
jgi:hypothetical protein